VADDDAVTRALLAATFERCGMECTLVEHGDAAMEAIRQDPPHAVILEVVMPGLDGFQVLAELKRSPELASVPVIMLSLRQSEPDILRSFGLGADDYITKPFSPMEVAARIKRLVERAS
jgi:DNA-binding response OmpR family regulator